MGQVVAEMAREREKEKEDRMDGGVICSVTGYGDKKMKHYLQLWLPLLFNFCISTLVQCMHRLSLPIFFFLILCMTA